MAGTRQMIDLAEEADNDYVIITLISSGGSSLMPLPRNGISLRDKKEMTGKLLNSGAKIREINAVRKHLSGFKGGWLAKKACPATTLNFVLSDVVGDALESIASGPTVPDSTTFTDARRVLKKHGLWKNASKSVRGSISSGEKDFPRKRPNLEIQLFRKFAP